MKLSLKPLKRKTKMMRCNNIHFKYYEPAESAKWFEFIITKEGGCKGSYCKKKKKRGKKNGPYR